MLVFGIDEIKTPIVKINFRKSETVEIDENLSEEYIKTTITTAPDKIKIKQAIKDGIVVYGARIVEHKNIQIK